MPRIDVPEGQDPLMQLWGGTDTALTMPAAKFSDAVYNKTKLPLREIEAARITIARINDCAICRTMRADDGPDEQFYDDLLAGRRDGDALSTREALASEFAERFATDHLNMDDELWERLHEAFSDDELVELGLCVGSWLAFGRLNRVFDVDGACRIPAAHVGGRVSTGS
ncbi:MAG: carboxymuconolactone decarboxylase family protein [Marmoricola sp.]